MVDQGTLLAAVGGLVGMVITYRLGIASTEAKDRRDWADRVRAGLRGRGVTADEIHRMLSLTPALHRWRLRAAFDEYQRAQADWFQDDSGQVIIRDPAAADAARDRLLDMLP